MLLRLTSHFHAGTTPRQRHQGLIRRSMEGVRPVRWNPYPQVMARQLSSIGARFGVVLPVREKSVRDLCSLAAVAALAPDPRLSAKAGHIPNWRRSYEWRALSLVVGCCCCCHRCCQRSQSGSSVTSRDAFTRHFPPVLVVPRPQSCLMLGADTYTRRAIPDLSLSTWPLHRSAFTSP